MQFHCTSRGGLAQGSCLGHVPALAAALPAPSHFLPPNSLPTSLPPGKSAHTSNTAPISQQVRAQSHSLGDLGPLHSMQSAQQSGASLAGTSPVPHPHPPRALATRSKAGSPQLHGWEQTRLPSAGRPHEGEFLLFCSGCPLLSAQTQAELYLGTSPLLPFQFRCSFSEMKGGGGGTPHPAMFLISFLQIKTTIYLNSLIAAECGAWKEQGRYVSQLQPPHPLPEPWPWQVFMDAEMRCLSSRSSGTLHSLLLLRPTGRQKHLPTKLCSLSAERDARRGAGQQQPGAGLPGLVASGMPRHSCLDTTCSREGVQLQIVGDHEQLQGKDSKLQMQDKISVISVEVFLLCCCTVLIKTCIFRHSD